MGVAASKTFQKVQKSFGDALMLVQVTLEATDRSNLHSERFKWAKIAPVSCVLGETGNGKALWGGFIEDGWCADKWQIEVLHLAGAYR